MREDELRELAGYPSAPEISFMGQAWAIREDGLPALIRFSLASRSDNPEEGTPLAVVYRLLEDCITDFSEFAQAAFDAKAEMEDLTAAIHQLASWYCARNHWPALRLIGYVAENLQELDGKLIRAGGCGIAGLSAREACNVALAACLEGRDEEDREMFLMDLDYEGDPASEALAQLRQMQAARKEADDG